MPTLEFHGHRRGAKSARLIKHIPAADEALLESVLEPAQKQALLDWLALPSVQERHGQDPDIHSISVVPANWSTLPGWKETAIGTQGEPTQLSRGHIFGLAAHARTTHEWLPVLVSSYAWGQGTNGYGPHRLRKILGTQPQDVESALSSAVTTVESEGSAQGYRYLQGRVTGLGPAFFTKFLYFAGHALPTGHGLAPLILDARVATSMRAIAASVYKARGLPDDLAAWLWSSGGWSPHRYETYLKWATQVTHAMHQQVTDWPDRPDLLELALFDGAFVQAHR